MDRTKSNRLQVHMTSLAATKRSLDTTIAARSADRPAPSTQPGKRRGSRKIVRSIWIGLLLGVLPATSSLFWLALLIPAFISTRLWAVLLAACCSWSLRHDLDALVDPIGRQILGHASLQGLFTSLSSYSRFHSLHWYNSVNLAYAVIFAIGTPVLAICKQGCLVVVRVAQRTRRESQLLSPVPLQVELPEQSVAPAMQSVQQDLDALRTIVASATRRDQPPTLAASSEPSEQPAANATTRREGKITELQRKLQVHSPHRSQDALPDPTTDAVKQPVMSKQLATGTPLHDQVWEDSLFVTQAEDVDVLSELLDTLPLIATACSVNDAPLAVSPTSESLHHSFAANDPLPPKATASTSTTTRSKKKDRKKKRGKLTVKETVIDIVRWKTPESKLSIDEKSSKRADTNALTLTTQPQELIGMIDSTGSISMKTEINQPIVALSSDAATTASSPAASDPPAGMTTLSPSLSGNDKASTVELANTSYVIAAEPLPYLLGYLTNSNRCSDKPGGR